MHVDRIPTHLRGRDYVSYLLRQTYREDGKVKHRTLSNLTPLPIAAIEAIRAILKGDQVGVWGSDFEIERSLPHGHVLAVLGMLRQLQLDRLLWSRPCRERDLVVAMVVRQVLKPSSKLATSRSWQSSTLASLLGVEDADQDELYSALDWLLSCQPKVETRLAERHLHQGALVLYDLTSVVVEGTHCKLAKLGHSRDGKPGTLQVEFGLVTDQEGRPVAVEVFAGNTGDPATVATQVEKLRQRFGLEQVVLVGDRGMLTSARISKLKELGGIGWISALRGVQIRGLVESGDLQLGLFDDRNLAEISSPRFPGERLVVCKNQELARLRSAKREDLLQATEKALQKVASSVAAGRLAGKDKIALRLGRVVNRYKMAKHFELVIEEQSFSFQRKQQQIAEEASVDGIYVIRSSVTAERLDAAQLVHSYKRLAQVERAFRTLKSMDMRVRPIRHRLEDRVRAHIFLCMLAYYVRWHLEQAWRPLLFGDEQPPPRQDPVAPAQRSQPALDKARTQRLADGTQVHDFSTLLEELATLSRETIRMTAAETTFDKLTTPTPLQQHAFSLLGIPITL
ncbi:MAG TPA: IS1634 family transposase [Candidatus Nanopelagicaceae bacterium]|nr:IS1634 family transposase [Candidatus Nanopelagicaceae bacterium]